MKPVIRSGETAATCGRDLRDERPMRQECPGECHRGMDSFDTWPLIIAPVIGAIMVCAVVVATAVTL